MTRYCHHLNGMRITHRHYETAGRLTGRVKVDDGDHMFFEVMTTDPLPFWWYRKNIRWPHPMPAMPAPSYEPRDGAA